MAANYTVSEIETLNDYYSMMTDQNGYLVNYTKRKSDVCIKQLKEARRQQTIMEGLSLLDKGYDPDRPHRDIIDKTT